MDQHTASIREVGQLLFRMAWADGEVKQVEVDLIANLLKNLGLPLCQRLPLMDGLMARPAQPTRPLTVRYDEPLELSRATLMELLVRVCFADMEAGPNEIALLGELALRWGISAEQLDQFRLKALQGVS